MGTQASAAPSEESVPCVARKPILSADEQVFGYELSFQPSSDDHTFLKMPNVRPAPLLIR